VKNYPDLSSAIQTPEFILKEYLTRLFKGIAKKYENDPAKQKELMIFHLFSILHHYEFDEVVTLFEEAEKQDIQKFTKDMRYACDIKNPEESRMEIDTIITNQLRSLGYEEAMDLFENTRRYYS